MDYLNTLRLQNTDQINLAWMEDFAHATGSQKMNTAVVNLLLLIQIEAEEA